MAKAVKKVKEEGTEIAAPKATALVAEPPVNLNDWGVPQLTSQDIIIPKILAMQAMSKQVVSGEAKMGEFRESLNGNILGDIANPIEFIPFYVEKVFVVMKKGKGENDQFKFSRQVPITAQTEGHPFFDTDPEGFQEKWYRTMNVYCLLPDQPGGIPHMFSFRSSSAKAGTKVATIMFFENIKAGKTPASMVLKVFGEKTKNDKGTFVVMDVKKVRESTKDEVANCFEWVKTVMAGKVKVDHRDLEAEATAETVSQEAPESTDY